MWDPAQVRMCANFVYDLNGTKGPNTMGKDIGFITVFYPTDSVVVAPFPHVRDSANAAQVAASGSQSASQVCTSLEGGEWRLPNIDEATALFVNKRLAGNYSDGGHYWTSSLEVANGNTYGLAMSLYSGAKLQRSRSTSLNVRCVKR